MRPRGRPGRRGKRPAAAPPGWRGGRRPDMPDGVHVRRLGRGRAWLWLWRAVRAVRGGQRPDHERRDARAADDADADKRGVPAMPAGRSPPRSLAALGVMAAKVAVDGGLDRLVVLYAGAVLQLAPRRARPDGILVVQPLGS